MKILKLNELLNAVHELSISGKQSISYMELLQLTDELSHEDYLTSKYQWRSCSESLPDPLKYDWVLVNIVLNGDNFRCVPQVAEYRGDGWYLSDGKGKIDESIYTVTHWKQIYDEMEES